MTVQKFLSIQSCVSYGYVGNCAITFPLQRLGVEVCPIHTVLFSNHTGYGSWKGQVLEPNLVEEIFEGLIERGVIQDSQALLTGYMGSIQLGNVMIRAIKQLKKINPNLIYCCDPVFGDVGRGIFVKEEIPNFFKNDLFKYADIVTPNHFELEFLSDMTINDLQTAIQAARKVMKIGPSLVIVTSLIIDTTKKDLNVLVVDNKNEYLLTTPRLPIALNGTGDLTSALFTYFYSIHQKINIALEETISRVYSIIAKTYEANSKELVLIESQDQLVTPKYRFESVKC